MFSKYINRSRFLKLVNGVWAIPLLLILRHFLSIAGLKIIYIRSDRIGHFPIDSIEALCRAEKSTKFRIYCIYGKPINKQWYKMLKKKFKFVNILFYVYFYENYLFRKMVLCEYGTFFESRDIKGNFAKNKICQLPFETEDNLIANKWMVTQGIKKNDKFICLLVRDAEYFKNNTNLNYHEHRNSDIDDYKEGILFLLDQGYWVIRMGRKTEKKVDINHPRWIDYSQSPEIQSDLMDIWLLSNCHGCISTSSGPDIISAIYNKPLCFINFIPVSICWSFSKSITAPKKLFSTEKKEQLKWNEMITNSYYKYEEYKKNKIKIIDLNSIEIKQVFEEFTHMINGKFSLSYELELLEIKLINDLKTNPVSKSKHQWFHPEFKLSSYLLNEQQLLLKQTDKLE